MSMRQRAHRAVARTAAVALVIALAAGASAETAPTDEPPMPSLGEQLGQQWTIEDITPRAEPRSYLQTRDDTLERLSLREAVAVALQNNPGIAVERLGPE